MTALQRCCVLVGGLLFAAGQADAQRSQRQDRARAGLSQSVEALLRSYELLELSAEQIEALEAIQDEAIQSGRQAEDRLRGLRSQLRAGEITREQIRDELEGAGDESRQAREAREQQVRELLSEEQLEQLSRARRGAARAFGRAGASQQGNLRRGRTGRGQTPRVRRFRDQRRPTFRGNRFRRGRPLRPGMRFRWGG